MKKSSIKRWFNRLKITPHEAERLLVRFSSLFFVWTCKKNKKINYEEKIEWQLGKVIKGKFHGIWAMEPLRATKKSQVIVFELMARIFGLGF